MGNLVKQGSGAANHPLWIRIAAFLSVRSPNTQTTYSGVIAEWCEYLGAPIGSLESARRMLSAQDLHAIGYRQWLEQKPGETPRWLKNSARNNATRSVEASKQRTRAQKKVGLEHVLSNATIHKKFAVLRRLYRMMLGADLGVKTNPFDSDKAPPPPKDSGRKRPTEMLDFSLVKKLLDVPSTDTPKGLQDRAILAVFFGAGLRRSEVQALRLGDLRKSSKGTPFLYLRSTKAKRDAQASLPGWAAEALGAHVAQRKKLGARESDFLFVTHRGKGGVTPGIQPLSASGIYKMFRTYCQRAGFKEFLTPHSARATAITKLLAQGIPHRLVQEFSRHASIQMVELYDKRRIGVDENPATELEFD